MGGLTKKLEGLKGQFQELVWGKGGLNKLLKGLVDLGTTTLKVINALGGFTPILTTIIGLLIVLKKTAIANLLISAKTFITTFIPTMISGLKGYVMALTSATTANEIFTASIPIVGLVLAGISALVMGYNLLKNATKTTSITVKDLSDSMAEESSEIESQISKIEDLKEELKEIDNSINKIEPLVLTEDKQLVKLKTQKAILEDQLTLENNLLQVAKDKAKIEARQTLKTKIERPDYDEGGTQSNLLGFQVEDTQRTVSESPLEAMQFYIDRMSIANNELTNLIKTKDEYIAQGITEGESYDIVNRLIQEKQDSLTMLTSDSTDYYNILNSMLSVFDETDVEYQAIITLIANYSAIVSDATENTDEQDKSIKKLATSFKTFEEAIANFDFSSTDLSGLQSAFEGLNQALYELNKSNLLTTESYDKLLSLSPEYLNVLFNEKGQIKDLEQATIDLYNAKIDEMAMSQARTLIDTATAYYNENQSLKGLSTQLQTTTSDTWDFIYASLSKLDVSSEENLALKNRIDTLKSWAEKAKATVTVNKKYTSSIESSTSATKDNTDALKEQKEALEKEISVYESAITYINSKLDDEIDKLEDLKDVALDSIDAQIDALKEQKDAEEQFWNDKINALNKQNDALEDQLEYEQLLANLAKAQSTKVKVYKEGQGFVYDVDQSAVNSAKKELEDYKRKKALADQIKELEQNRDNKLKIYDKQIADLERYKDRISQNYDAQIQYYKDYKSNFKNMVDSYDIEQNRLQALQLTGIDFEKDGWQARLKNLDSFASAYTKKLQTLKTMTEEYNKASGVTTKSSGGGVGGIGSSLKSPTSQPKGKNYYVYQTLDSFDSKVKASSKIGMLNGDGIIQVGNKYLVIKWKSGGYSTMGEASSNISNYNGNGVYKRYYSGADSIDSNQMALVGDSPNNRELIIGSKLNGQMMNLSKGSGVVNAKSTNTLAGILNSLGSINQPLSENSSLSQGFSISIGNLSLPNVQNPTDFVKGIKELAIQKAYSLV